MSFIIIIIIIKTLFSVGNTISYKLLFLEAHLTKYIQTMKICKQNKALKNFNLRCRNGTNLAVLNLHISPMPPTKFQLNLTYHSGADVVSRLSRWPLQRPSWISEGNDFSHSESPSCSDAFHQVSAQSNLRFGRRCHLKIFKMDDMATTLDIRME